MNDIFYDLPKAIETAKLKNIVPVIAEIKRLIPKYVEEKGMKKDLRDAGKLAVAYERGGAAAISVVTEKLFFGGQPTIDIPKILGSVSLPLLIKDFIKDESGVDYYRRIVGKINKHYIPRVTLLLDCERVKMNLMRLINYTLSNGFGVLAQTRRFEDLGRISFPEDGCLIIGYNNKDISILEKENNKVNLTKSLVRDYRLLIGKNILISESGHESCRDIKRSILAGVDAVLVGTAFMLAKNPMRVVHDFVHAYSR